MALSISRSLATSEESLISYDAPGETLPGTQVLAPEQQQSRLDNCSIPSSSAIFSLSNLRIRPSNSWTESFSCSNSSQCLSVHRYVASSLPLMHLSSVSNCALNLSF